MSELIAGMAAYMDNDDIPVPTKEDGKSTPFTPVEDIDNRDEQDPSNTEITVNVDIIRENNNIEDTVESEVPEVTPVEDINVPGVEQMYSVGDKVKSHVYTSIEDYRLYLRSETNTICNKCHKYISQIRISDMGMASKEGVPGNAGLVDLTKNMATDIANTFGHFLNLFRTALFNGFRDFKRSELTEYNQSNRLTMTRLYASDNYERLNNITVPTPRGMVGTYSRALSSIQNFLSTLQMTERVREIKAVVKDIHKDLSNGSTSAINMKVGDMKRRMVNPQVKTLFNVESSIFTNSSKDTNTFDKLFTSQADYEKCVKDTMEMDTEFRMVSGIHSDLEEIDRIIGNIVPFSHLLTNQQLNDISVIIQNSAQIFDMYANVIQDLNRLNHNLTVVTQDIRNKLNM